MPTKASVVTAGEGLGRFWMIIETVYTIGVVVKRLLTVIMFEDIV